jgi:hypothetical protein
MAFYGRIRGTREWEVQARTYSKSSKKLICPSVVGKTAGSADPPAVSSSRSSSLRFLAFVGFFDPARSRSRSMRASES